jgi:hypothetical protein
MTSFIEKSVKRVITPYLSDTRFSSQHNAVSPEVPREPMFALNTSLPTEHNQVRHSSKSMRPTNIQEKME